MQRLLFAFFVTVAIGAIILGIASCDTGTRPSSESRTAEATTLSTTWIHTYKVAGGIRMPPETVGDSLVLFGAEARLQALDVGTGEVTWKSASVSPSTLEIKGRDLLIGGQTAYAAHVLKVHAWNLRDGSRRWTFDRPSDTGLYDLGYFALGPDHIFAFGMGGELLRIDRTTGEGVNVRTFAGAIVGARYHEGFLYLGQVRVPEGAEGQSQGILTKVDATTGDTLWTFETERGGFYDMRPIVHDDRVFAGTREGDAAFFAVDKKTGEEIWRNRQGYTFAADHGDGYIYLNTSAELMGISEETGRTVWKTDMPGGSGFGGVEYHDGYVYHPRGSTLVVVDAEDGTIVHQEPSPGGYFWAIHAGAGQIFAQSSRHLIAYEPFQP